MYPIHPNYHTYSYKPTVNQFSSLQITASVLFVYFYVKAYVLGTTLKCTNLSMQLKLVPTTHLLLYRKSGEKKKNKKKKKKKTKKKRKKKQKKHTKTLHKHHLISPSFFFFYSVPLVQVCLC